MTTQLDECNCVGSYDTNGRVSEHNNDITDGENRCRCGTVPSSFRAAAGAVRLRHRAHVRDVGAGERDW